MKYRKIPVEIEAFKYDGDLISSDGEYYAPNWAETAYKEGTLYYDSVAENEPPCELFIQTLEGRFHVSVGDYIIRGVQGELYPCKPDIFEQTYEEVKDRQCNKCSFYNGVHNVMGHAPCSKRQIGGVLWNDSCDQFLAVEALRGEQG